MQLLACAAATATATARNRNEQRQPPSFSIDAVSGPLARFKLSVRPFCWSLPDGSSVPALLLTHTPAGNVKKRAPRLIRTSTSSMSTGSPRIGCSMESYSSGSNCYEPYLHPGGHSGREHEARLNVSIGQTGAAQHKLPTLPSSPHASEVVFFCRAHKSSCLHNFVMIQKERAVPLANAHSPHV